MEKKYDVTIPMVNISAESIADAKKIFRSYKETGVILAGTFSDKKWLFSNEYQRLSIIFDVSEADYDHNYRKILGIEYEDFVDYLKAYICCLLGTLALTTLQNFVNEIKKIVCFPPDQLYMDEDTSNVLYRVSEFFTLLPVQSPESDTLLEMIDAALEDGFRRKSRTQRVLASFMSYFKFNDIIVNYWENETDKKLKLFYFPLFFWWSVTAIIPLRPRELIVTPRKCLQMIKGKYYLTLRRNAIKGKSKHKTYKIDSDYETYTYEIPESLGKEIQWYIDATEDMIPGELDTLIRMDTHYDKWKRCAGVNNRFFTYINLTTVLRYFYSEVIHDSYGYRIIEDPSGNDTLESNEIEFIHLGDTRHIAMINLVLEGVSPAIVMQLAGHDNLLMAVHYYTNITKLVECRTYRQYQKSLKGTTPFNLTVSQPPVNTSEYTPLPDNGRCYSEKVKYYDYSDCDRVLGENGELGHCPNCLFYRPGNIGFNDSSEGIYKSRIQRDTERLLEIVNLYRHSKGDYGDLLQAQMLLKDSCDSYAEFLKETRYGKTEKL